MLHDAFPEFIRTSVKSPKQRKLLQVTNRAIRQQITPTAFRSVFTFPLYSVQVPMLVYEALQDDRHGAISVGLSALTYAIGVNLLDDVMDGDHSRYGAEIGTKDGLLLGVTLVAGLAPIALRQHPASESARGAALDAMLEGSMMIAEGQQLEFELKRRVTEARARQAAELKTGHGVGALRKMAALLGGATKSRELDAWYAIGFHLGTARQIASDIGDLQNPEHSRDLAAGLISLPIAMYLENCRGMDRSRFRRLLQLARADGAARTQVAELLWSARIDERCADEVSAHLSRLDVATGMVGHFHIAREAIRLFADATK